MVKAATPTANLLDIHEPILPKKNYYGLDSISLFGYDDALENKWFNAVSLICTF